MAKNSIITILFLSLISTGHGTPVLIWRAQVNQKTVFPQVRQHEFLEEVKPLLETRMVAAFTYDKLSLSSFRCEECFPFLSQESPAVFYANVEKADKSLLGLKPKAQLSVDIDGKLNSTLTCGAGKLYMISLDALGKASNPMKRCDEAMKKITESANCPDVAYLFMGKEDEVVELSGRLYQHNQISFYFTQIQMQSADFIEDIILLNMNVSGTDPMLSVELKSNNTDTSLSFHVQLSSGYFEIRTFYYNDTAYYVSDLYAPQTNSYSCGKIVLRNKDKGILTIRRLQIQYDQERHGDFMFKDAWTCEGFTSPAIISGLFVTAILLGILFLGIGMLMSVQAPTKYDNPIGPGLHINVTD
uniref:V-type proton ATPase subunit S1/VOA1 transmembrane domain-containing protein n=1 Tax=Ceratitis capitata TaxID=7213 RepID=W8BR83_CERCA